MKVGYFVGMFILVSFYLQAQMINGGFDENETAEYTGQDINGWRVAFWAEATGTFHIVDDVKNSGDRALKIIVNNTPGDNPRKV